jgi:ABC-2 type transport system permease protein
MAVYKRSYKRFEGDLTDQRWRFTILPRYSFQTVFESKLMTSFFTFCLLPHLVALILIYLHHNLGALKALDAQFLQFLAIDGNFFLTLFEAETFLSFLLVTFIGPGLVAPDLANNALPLYLSRPFSRQEYIIGKLSVLVILTSLITWIPGFLLIGVQTNEAGLSWLSDNVRIPIGMFVGSLIWTITISLVSLALSAWVKMRPAAVFALFGAFFVAGSFGTIANTMLDLRPAWGVLMNMNATMQALWNWLLLGRTDYGTVFVRGRIVDSGLPSWAALVSLMIFAGLSLFLLMKKIRACEVVR